MRIATTDDRRQTTKDGPETRAVAVIGPGQCGPELAALAEEVGAGLGAAGVTLVCGGLGGVMEAACRGAKGAGGRTVGILPGNARRDANPWVDLAIVTGMGEARNLIVVKSAQAVIAIGGAFGTLSEIALALRENKPVVGLRTWQLAHPDGFRPDIVRATSPAEAVELALALLAGAEG